MEKIALIILCQTLLGCVLTPPIESNRKTHPALNDLDNIEMLIHDDQQLIYGTGRNTASEGTVRLGMQKNKVQLHLGHPTLVEVAGNPKYGNERWIYERSVPTMDGFFTEKKVIYFEGGSVVGWETH